MFMFSVYINILFYVITIFCMWFMFMFSVYINILFYVLTIFCMVFMFMFSVYINNKKELLLPTCLITFKSYIYMHIYLYVTRGQPINK